MFPNPQDVLPLARRPNGTYYKKLATELVKACKSKDESAIDDWAEEWVTTVAKKSGVKFTRQLPVAINRWIGQVKGFAKRTLLQSDGCRLSDAQYVIARSHGFETWSKFSRHLAGLGQKHSEVASFEAAAEAIIKGDIKTLKRLLRSQPSLVHARSTREHGAMLLHYVSANGVEGYRQKTPKNIVAITELLLEAGAEADAEADVYGGGATTLGLAATSIHPFLAGVQNPLMQILLDHGAEIDHTTSAGNQQSAVMGCLANGRGEAAIYLADRGARLDLESAAGVGRLDVVKSYFNEDGSLKRNVTRKRLHSAFLYACGWGRQSVIQFLLDKEINLSTHGGDGQTPLHWAAIGGDLKTVKLLLKFHPPLEKKNIYGGTVLGQTLWSAAHGGDPRTYAAIIKTLIAAGAKVPARHAPVNKPIDNLLRKYGSVPEPSWYWFGEKPQR
jgi:ankyrin repeat protein